MPRALVMPGLLSLVLTINDNYNEAESNSESAIKHALACGEALAQAKKRVKHDDWARWLAIYTQIPERTASQYINLSNNQKALKRASASVKK